MKRHKIDMLLLLFLLILITVVNCSVIRDVTFENTDLTFKSEEFNQNVNDDRFASHFNHKRGKNVPSKYRNWKDKEMSILENIHSLTNEECHRTAISKCGHTFIRAYKFLDYNNPKEAFEPRCALRKAFFSCLKTWQSKLCHKSKAAHSAKFRKKLSNTLWSTRTCLLGIYGIKFGS